MAVVADRIRAHLDSKSWQRFHCGLIVTLSAASAFLASRLLIRLHVWPLSWRYGFAALAGYAAFLLLIRLWVMWKSSRLADDDDAPVSRVRGHGGGASDVVSDVIGDASDIEIPLPSRGGGGGRAAVNAFSGGRSGGGGSSMAFEEQPQPVAVAHVSSSSSSSGSGHGGGFSLDIDGDDLFWLIVAVVAAFAGVCAVTYVVWVAPTFLGEAAVNAAVAGKVYHGMQRRESSHWTQDQFKRTIVPALIVVASATAAGYAFNRIAPEAVTVGGVWHHLAAKYGW